MKVIIINGPNLNLLGQRQPEIYGNQPFEEKLDELKAQYPDIELSYFQNNSEGTLIDKLHEVGFSYDGIIFNPGGYSHTSVALADAVASIKTPVVEVHISNIYSREEFRRHSFISPHSKAVISGLGLYGYDASLQFLISEKI